MKSGPRLAHNYGFPVRTAISVLAATLLAGCSNVSQLQESVSKLSEMTHAVSTAQNNFLSAVRKADCNDQFYQQASDWAEGKQPNIDLSGTCIPTLLSDDQIMVRHMLMDSITLYADKMAALATSDNNKSLNQNSQELAKKINGLVRQGGIQDLSIASAVESSVITISQIVLDATVQSDIKGIASSQQNNLATVANALEKENSNYASEIERKGKMMERRLKPIVLQTPRDSVTAKFFDVVNARTLIQTINPFGTIPVAASPGGIDPNLVPSTVATKLNSALDGVVAANAAIADSGMGGILAAVNDLVARAQAARDVQAALAK